MKLIDIKCPNCGGELHIEDNREFAFCQFCGHKIMLCREKSDDDTISKLNNLKKLLKAQTKSGVGGADVPDLCDEILRLDPDCHEAWIHKGLATDDLSTKINCFVKGVENMDVSEYDDYYSVLSSHLANFLFDNELETWYPYIFSDLDLQFSAVKPDDSDKDDFILETLEKLGEKIINCNDSDVAIEGLDKYGELTIVSISIYCSIETQRDILVSIIRQLDEMRSNYRHFTLNSDKRLDNKITAECFKLNMDFLKKIVDAMNDEMKKHSGKQLDKITEFWKEDGGIGDLSTLLHNAYGMNVDLLNAGMLESIKIKKNVSELVKEYMERYFQCISPE